MKRWMPAIFYVLFAMLIAALFVFLYLGGVTPTPAEQTPWARLVMGAAVLLAAAILLFLCYAVYRFQRRK